jgi:hypothetical protein
MTDRRSADEIIEAFEGDPDPFPAQNPSIETKVIAEPEQAPVGWLAMRHADGRLRAVAPGTEQLDAMHREGGWEQQYLPTRRRMAGG